MSVMERAGDAGQPRLASESSHASSARSLKASHQRNGSDLEGMR